MHVDSVVFDFLKILEKNNNRDWFKENKNLYQVALENVQNFAAGLIAGVSSFDPSVGNLEAKDTIFRIYRDVRFSPDKRPYKTHVGIFIAPNGKKSNDAGYYLHIQNDNSIIGGGLWCPENTLLKKIREEIYYAPEDLVQIIENEKFKSTFGELADIENLKRPPKGYSADFEHIKLLQYRHFTVEKRVSNKEVLSDNFLDIVLTTFKTMYPMVDYFNKLVRLED